MVASGLRRNQVSIELQNLIFGQCSCGTDRLDIISCIRVIRVTMRGLNCCDPSGVASLLAGVRGYRRPLCGLLNPRRLTCNPSGCYLFSVLMRTLVTMFLGGCLTLFCGCA